MKLSSDFESICYNRNYLDKVIFRIDFLTEISHEVINSTNVIKSIMKNFPVNEKDRIVYENKYKVKLKKAESELAQEQAYEIVEKVFTDSEKGKRLTFSSRYLIVEIFDYNVFDLLLSYVEEILKNIDSNIVVSRMGLRYINNYEFKEKQLFNFQKYFNKKLLSFRFIEELDEKILAKRAINIQEYIFNNNNLRFQYGLYNPDFPATIKKKAFVLDYDCYYQNIIEDKNIILPKFKELHYLIQYFFEKSITDKMKDEMNQE
ncbi:MAG: TIGR04255 family protein [Candidatus Lokiarchaeota archaeon]|nr:TIGR04255 family protein [Candidatus Lokiarchaeota archaeon]